MNAVGRKISSLLSSGAVSVTGPSQQRIVKHPSLKNTQQANQQQHPQQYQNQQQHHQQQTIQKTVYVTKGECYVCDEHIGNNGTLVTEALTTCSNTKIPMKIGRIVGDAFMVIVSNDDVICKRCVTMFNQMDRLEQDLDRVKSSILNLINKKYGINDNGNAGGNTNADIKPPPTKVQRLNTSSGTVNTHFANRKTSNGGDAEDETITRKITSTVPILQPLQAQSTNQFGGNSRVLAVQQPAVQQKKPIKIYKCMSCEFKTTDIKLFQPHYDACRQQNGYRCKVCKKVFANVSALKTHSAEKHASEFTCNLCNINYVNENTFKKHMETNHPDIKTVSNTATGQQIYSCSLCQFKAYDKAIYDAHSRKHVKAKPFKCRICSERFENKEQASQHAKIHCPDYFKCGTCAMTFPQKDQLMKHFEVHKQQGGALQHIQQKQIVQQIQQQPQMQQAQIVSQDLTTQKLLQDTIDEALRETGDSGPKINFYSCRPCSLTFIQETYYKQHMDTHKRETNKKLGTSTVAPTTTTVSTSAHSLIRTDQRIVNAPTSILQAAPNASISDTDLEIMFEKMHSDKAEIEGNPNSTDGLVITSQESSSGGYTFNITMANQPDSATNNVELENDLQDKVKQEASTIDMPHLSETDTSQTEQQPNEHDQHTDPDQHQQAQLQQHDQEHLDDGSVPVNMPSLDDDPDASQPSSTDQVPMDLEDIQNAAESGQIKFILNENGQLIQLDNHILTTDADGNQILVQDSEQIQQLLQSVGVLQATDGEGGEQTFQMIQGENNQMILVQGDNNEAQLIDASMLNEDGQLVIQHHGDGELPQGMHVVNEDGVQVPVSIAFAQHLDESSQQHEIHQQDGEHDLDKHHEQDTEHHQDHHMDDEQSISIKTEETSQDGEQQLHHVVSETDSGITTVTTSNRAPVTSTAGGEVYFSLDEIINQSEQKV